MYRLYIYFQLNSNQDFFHLKYIKTFYLNAGEVELRRADSHTIMFREWPLNVFLDAENYTKCILYALNESCVVKLNYASLHWHVSDNS